MDRHIGRGRFMLGDCLERMSELPDASVDMILCDLPYGTTACAWDQVIPFEPLWREYWRIAKPGAVVALTASQPFTSALVMSQTDRFRHEWIWKKNVAGNFANANHAPMKEHESVLIFCAGKVPYRPIKESRQGAGASRAKYPARSNTTGHTDHAPGLKASEPRILTELRFPSSVQAFVSERGLHPTQKPVALFEYLIRTYTDAGMTVLDNCAGSGTTAIAAERSGRNWICIERDPDYYAKACERVETEIASKGLFA